MDPPLPDGCRRHLPPGVPVAARDAVDRRVMQALRDWWKGQPGPAYLYGATGTGKTCAAAVVFTRWPQHALWFATGDLVRNVATSRQTGQPVAEFLASAGRHVDRFAEDYLRLLGGAPLVVMDDIGTTQPTPGQYDALLAVLNTRCGKHTLYTGNLTPERLRKEFDDRVYSRVCCGANIPVAGPDRRMAK